MLLTYAGDPGRYYPTLGITPVPGQEYDLAAHPRDGLWLPEPEPDPEPEPADQPEPESTTTPAPETTPARRRMKKEATDA